MITLTISDSAAAELRAALADQLRPTQAPLPPTRTLRATYPSAQALQADSDQIRFDQAITVDGTLIHHGFGPQLAYSRQPDGSVRLSDLPNQPIQVPQTPSPTATNVIVPPEFAGKPITSTWLPWAPYTDKSKRFSQGFDDSTVWAIHFLSGGTIAGNPRIQAIESGSQPVRRTYALVRDSDNAVLIPTKPDDVSPNVTINMSATESNDWTVQIAPNTSYTLFIANLNGGGGGQMMVELYL